MLGTPYAIQTRNSNSTHSPTNVTVNYLNIHAHITLRNSADQATSFN